MSKKFRSQASSARAATTLNSSFGAGSSFQTSASPLSYVTEQPDLSQINEPNLVVAFKNLGKKDSTTKSKALEELQENFQGEIGQEILQAWAEIYPRTSIDNSRRVRQLAHTIQGNLTVSAGKRIAPLLPRIITSWLAGTFDSDKSVSRAAHDALDRSFTSPEKRKALLTLYSSSILEYLEDAITVQTAATLSDERTTSVDDAQAKYVRVVATGINLLSYLIRSGVQDVAASTILSGKKIWEHVYHGDPHLRRSVCELVIAVVEKHPDVLDWSAVSTCFLSKGLQSTQVASSRQYTAALLLLTRHRQQLWTTDYSSKTAVSKRFLQFLRHGSQNGPEDVWSNVAAIIRTIPEQVWLSDSQMESASTLVEALRTGVTLQSERSNAASAWAVYVQTCLWIAEKLGNEKGDFVDQQLVPIVSHYVSKTEESQWNTGTKAVLVCKGVLVGMIKISALSTFMTTWSALVDLINDQMKLSQPETSKDFKLSQENVVERAKRFFKIKSEILKTDEVNAVARHLEQGDQKLLEAAISLLKNRNGKPYGSAAVIEMVISQPHFDVSNSVLQSFVEHDLLLLIDSPSSERLASISLRCGRTDILSSLVEKRSHNTDDALCYTLKNVRAQDVNTTVKEQLLNLELNNSSNLKVLTAIMQNANLKELQADICLRIQTMIAPDSSENVQQTGLTYLEEALTHAESASSLMADENRVSLLPNLLLLKELDNNISEQANTVLLKLNQATKTGSGLGSESGSVTILQQQLKGESVPLSVSTLIDLANGIIGANVTSLSPVLPVESVWQKAVSDQYASPRPLSLAIVSPLQGAIYQLAAGQTISQDIVQHDSDGLSLVYRLTLYVTHLLNIPDATTRIGEASMQALHHYYPIALQLINEKLTQEDANDVWLQTTPDILQEAADLLSDGNRLVQSWLERESFIKLWFTVAHDLTDNDIRTYVVAQAWLSIASQYVDQHGPGTLLKEYEQQIKSIHKSKSVVQSAAMAAVLQDLVTSSASIKRVLNELIVDATEAKDDNIKPIVLLNVMLQGSADVLETIPTQRLVFLLKNLVRLCADRGTQGMQFEAMKLLATILSHVQDIYGEHWEQMIASVIKTWSGEADLPEIYASIKLYVGLKSLASAEDANEDLDDAMKAAKGDLDEGLVECLKQLGKTGPQIDQPRAIVAELVRRQLRDVRSQNVEGMYSLLASSVEAVQSAAYEILHRQIPLKQEQLSVELILEKSDVKLPEEVFAVVADGPDEERRYLLAWNLIFDHFSQASYKLQEAYTTGLKASGHIDHLLTFICDKMNITGGRPIDASKFNISDFNVEASESNQREIEWLTIHNYYRSLLCVPSLAKEWFISQKNRTKTPLEAWTQKHISPIIVAASLSTVTAWAESNSQADEERSLTIKSSPRGSELTASIEVDPESPPISLTISLPGSYPLESPVVISRLRVGVSEKNWQSWLRTIQIIIFSTGSIVEGLIAFRRNVLGALKGQGECAICYSIIGTDMQTPNKKCGTCKNMFHGSCLFRWFKSSNSSSCPLCRNNFNYA